MSRPSKSSASLPSTADQRRLAATKPRQHLVLLSSMFKKSSDFVKVAREGRSKKDRKLPAEAATGAGASAPPSQRLPLSPEVQANNAKWLAAYGSWSQRAISSESSSPAASGRGRCVDHHGNLPFEQRSGQLLPVPGGISTSTATVEGQQLPVGLKSLDLSSMALGDRPDELVTDRSYYENEDLEGALMRIREVASSVGLNAHAASSRVLEGKANVIADAYKRSRARRTAGAAQAADPLAMLLTSATEIWETWAQRPPPPPPPTRSSSVLHLPAPAVFKAPAVYHVDLEYSS